MKHEYETVVLDRKKATYSLHYLTLTIKVVFANTDLDVGLSKVKVSTKVK